MAARRLEAENGRKHGEVIQPGCGFLVWFIAFLAVGGERFAIWQSQVWNGQQRAFRILASILLVLIFVAQPDAEV
jgi:predicted small integral membrane protein